MIIKSDKLTNAEYHARPGISRSDLWAIQRNPAAWLASKQDGGKSTAAMDRGNRLHEAVLEPDLFEQNYFTDDLISELNFATKAGKAAKKELVEQNAGKTLIKSADLDLIAGMRSALLSHPVAGEIIRADGENELSLFWEHELPDVNYRFQCKARLDIWRPNYNGFPLAADIKTISGIDRFERTAYEYGYHIQPAHYGAGIRSALDVPSFGFVFLIVDSYPPHGVRCVQFNEDSMSFAEFDLNRCFMEYSRCLENDTYPGPGYDWEKRRYGVETVSLPKWVYYQNEG